MDICRKFFVKKIDKFFHSLLYKNTGFIFPENFRYAHILTWERKYIIVEINFFEDKIILFCYVEEFQLKERKTQILEINYE